MKTLSWNNYRYLGEKDGWHVFECIKDGFDKEVLFLSRARMIMEDGTSKFFDPLCPQDELSIDLDSYEERRKKRLLKYSMAISKSASVKPVCKVRRIPKRNVAGSNEPVSYAGYSQ